MKAYRWEILSALMLAAGMGMDTWAEAWPIGTDFRFFWYLAALLPVALPVVREAAEALLKRDVFNEFMLMTLAAAGAFILGEYPEGVAVMLLYAVGEKLQDGAVDRARDNIRALLDLRPAKAAVWRNGQWAEVHPSEVKTGETVEVKPGERIPLDGVLEEDSSPVTLDTSALTGESVPQEVQPGGRVLAGTIALQTTLRVRVTRPYEDSALARVLQMVEDSASRKAPAERFMRRVARVYTPVVFGAAVLLVLIPYIYSMLASSFDYVFADWFYRSLVFLVISCPCALVISIPLCYYSSVGAASRRGILFKGGAYIDAVAGVDTILFDKTGTLTCGRFDVTRIVPMDNMPEETLLRMAAAVEAGSNHPLAEAVRQAAEERKITVPAVEGVREQAGLGVSAMVDGRSVVAGNRSCMDRVGITVPVEAESEGTAVYCAVDGLYAGYLLLQDAIKPETAAMLAELKRLGVKHREIVSGDRDEWVKKLTARLGLERGTGGLLPAGKVERLQTLLQEGNRQIAFVGDGINDAPVLSLAPVGIAMGGLGSDATIEAADVVIQDDSLTKIPLAIRIGRRTRRLIRQNIIFAFAVKAIVLGLGACGIASLWAAVFADTGVALLAVANAMRVGVRLTPKTNVD